MQDGHRRAPRLATNLKIDYRRADRTGSCTCLDLSMGGVFLHVSEEFEPEQWLDLSFQVSIADSRRPVHCLGQISRVLSVSQAASYGLLPGIAVEFRKFVQGLEELRSYLAQRLELPAEALGEPALGPVPLDAFYATQPTPIPAAVSASRIAEPPIPAAVSVSRAPEPPPVHVAPAAKRTPEPIRERREAVNYEPPPVAAATRRSADGTPSKPAQAPPSEDGKGWTREDWQAYFASMKAGARKKNEHKAVAQPEQPASRDVRALLFLALKTAGAGIGVALLLHLVQQLTM